MEWKNFLETIVVTSHCPITFAGDHPNVLSRWLVRSVYADTSQAWGMEPYLDNAGSLLSYNEIPLQTQETLEANWRPYVSDAIHRFQQVNTPKKFFVAESDKYLYCLCNVYCEKEQDLLLNNFTFLPSPTRVWINGHLIYAGSHEYIIKDYFSIYRFEEGNNTVLVECPLSLKVPLTEQEFAVRVYPVERLTRDRSEFDLLDDDFLNGLRQSYGIFPEKLFYSPGEDISIVVLPRYSVQGTEEPIKITAYDARGDQIQMIHGFTSRKIVIPGDVNAKGVVCIKAESLERRDKYSEIHVFLGDFTEQTNALLAWAEVRPNFSKEMIESFRQLTDMPNAFKQLNQYMTGNFYNNLFRKMTQFQNHLDVPVTSHELSYVEVFGSNFTVFEKNKTDDAYTAYTIYLPENYRYGEPYPLVLYFTDGLGRSYPDELPWLKRSSFSGAVIVNIVGVGRVNYADDIQVIQTIGRIVEQYSIDRHRIYVIGFCTGALKAFRLAFKMPDLFAGIVSVIGSAFLNVNHPEYEYLDNIGNTPVFGLCSTEDWFFNSARQVEILKRLNRSKIRHYSGFMHTEFNVLHNSKKLFEELIQAKKEKMPPKLEFTVLEPGFNKSHWVIVDHITDLNARAVIKAEIKAGGNLAIDSRNIRRFRLLLNRKAMKLGDEAELVVNGISQRVGLERYCAVSVEVMENRISAQMIPLSKESFDSAYNRIGADEHLMGIKKLYVNACTIVKPDKKKDTRRTFTMKLAYLLQNPIKDRHIYYKYESCQENEFDLEKRNSGNFIWIMDARNISPKQKMLLDCLEIRLEPGGMSFGDSSCSGDYFSLITCRNPVSPDHFILVVAFNSDNLEDEMIRFMSAFETDPLFDQDSIVYNQGTYQAFRTKNGELSAVGGIG